MFKRTPPCGHHGRLLQSSGLHSGKPELFFTFDHQMFELQSATLKRCFLSPRPSSERRRSVWRLPPLRVHPGKQPLALPAPVWIRLSGVAGAARPGDALLERPAERALLAGDTGPSHFCHPFSSNFSPGSGHGTLPLCGPVPHTCSDSSPDHAAVLSALLARRPVPTGPAPSSPQHSPQPGRLDRSPRMALQPGTVRLARTNPRSHASALAAPHVWSFGESRLGSPAPIFFPLGFLTRCSFLECPVQPEPGQRHVRQNDDDHPGLRQAQRQNVSPHVHAKHAAAWSRLTA